MKRLLTACAIVIGVIFCVGFMLPGEEIADRLTIRVLAEKRIVTVSVSIPDVSEAYRWLSVYACSAQMLEHGVFCTGDFERESSFEITSSRKQYLVDWRDLPGGTIQITAMAFDVDEKILAQGQTVVFRGR